MRQFLRNHTIFSADNLELSLYDIVLSFSLWQYCEVLFQILLSVPVVRYDSNILHKICRRRKFSMSPDTRCCGNRVKLEGFSDVYEQKIKKIPPAAGFLRNFTFNPILHFLFEILGIQGGLRGGPKIILPPPLSMKVFLEFL